MNTMQNLQEGGTGTSDGDAQRIGRGFLIAMHAAIRALKLYPLENRAVQNTLTDLQRQAELICEREDAIVLSYAGDFCFVNDLRLRGDLSSYSTFSAIGRHLNRHGIGAVEIQPGTSGASWTAFLTLLLQDPATDDPFEGLTRRLEAASAEGISVEPRSEEGEGRGVTDEAREAAKKTYAQSVAVAKEVMLGMRMGRGVVVRRVKRAVQQMVDQVLNNESSMMGMTVLRDFDTYTFTHSVNVCIFSIALGKKLDLSRNELFELGMGALLHDIGKVKMPIEVLTKPSGLDNEEWDTMREHPTEGMLSLLEMPRMGELPLRAILAAYEHHMKIDLSGYPAVKRSREPTLFSRIVGVADGFDAGTARRVYQDQPCLPDAVLRDMRDNPKRGVDPLLVKAFISMTGFYPVGSVVILDTFELAVVVASSTKPDSFHQPVVRVIYDDMGMPVTEERTVDLTEIDPATGQPLRRIIKTTDPEKYGIDVRNYFA